MRVKLLRVREAEEAEKYRNYRLPITGKRPMASPCYGALLVARALNRRSKRFSYVETQDGIAIYTLILNHVSLKRNLKIVVLVDERNKDKKKYTILFSTDTELDAKTLVRYYKARFQIEFIFRDAKQFTGLCDCQARDQARLDFHFNASLTTLNLAKLEHLQAYADTEPGTFSMASIKACYFNTFFLQHIFSMLDLDLNLMKKSSQYQRLRDYGKIAA